MHAPTHLPRHMPPCPHDDEPPSAEWDRDAHRAMQVRLALAAIGVASHQSINVEVIAGRVRLDGQVSSFHTKQLAQEAARRVAGINEIVNLLEVASDHGPDTPPASAGDRKVEA